MSIPSAEQWNIEFTGILLSRRVPGDLVRLIWENDLITISEEARALDDGQAIEPSQFQGGDQIHINGTIRTANTPEEGILIIT